MSLSQKAILRHVAKPHLHSPAHLLEFLRNNQRIVPQDHFINQQNHFPSWRILDLSHAACMAFAQRFSAPTRNGCANLEFSFGSLEGIEDLINHVTGARADLYVLDLSGHAFATFDLKKFKKNEKWNDYFKSINLAGNAITAIEGKQLEIDREMFVTNEVYFPSTQRYSPVKLKIDLFR